MKIRSATHFDLPGILEIYNEAHFKQVGFKFGRWLDVIYMEKLL